MKLHFIKPVAGRDARSWALPSRPASSVLPGAPFKLTSAQSLHPALQPTCCRERPRDAIDADVLLFPCFQSWLSRPLFSQHFKMYQALLSA